MNHEKGRSKFRERTEVGKRIGCRSSLKKSLQGKGLDDSIPSVIVTAKENEGEQGGKEAKKVNIAPPPPFKIELKSIFQEGDRKNLLLVGDSLPKKKKKANNRPRWSQNPRCEAKSSRIRRENHWKERT